MGVVRRFAVAGLDEAARRGGRQWGLRVGAIDESSRVKQGSATAGVKRQYLGCVGKVAKGIATVHRHQARSRWYHQRTRLARDTDIALVSSVRQH